MGFNLDVGLRLRDKRKEKQLSMKELGERVGLSEATIQRYETGQIKGVDINLINKFAEVLNTSAIYLMGWDDKPPLPAGAMPLPTQTVKIPVLGKVAAGVPIEMVTDILGYEEIDANWQGEYFALRISGRSMEPKIADGDIVIVKKQERVENGEIAVVTVNGEDATVKKVMLSPDGIILVPFNAEYETKFYANDEILSLPVDILGKVVEARRKF